jgi:hypothetical protein
MNSVDLMQLRVRDVVEAQNAVTRAQERLRLKVECLVQTMQNLKDGHYVQHPHAIDIEVVSHEDQKRKASTINAPTHG